VLWYHPFAYRRKKMTKIPILYYRVYGHLETIAGAGGLKFGLL